MKLDVAHETQGFILVWGMVHAKPYSSGAAALLVFVCSITGAVTPSYMVDSIPSLSDQFYPSIATMPADILDTS